MKLSEVFGGFFKAAQDAGIAIEADEAVTQPAAQAPVADSPRAADTDALKAQVEVQEQALAAAQARIATMEQDARTARLTALAKGWHGDVQGHLTVLEALGEGTPAYTAYAQQQAGVAETLRQSKVFESFGSDRAETADAWALVESRAAALVKDTPGLTIQQARVRVIEADPTLYARYESERHNG